MQNEPKQGQLLGNVSERETSNGDRIVVSGRDSATNLEMAIITTTLFFPIFTSITSKVPLLASHGRTLYPVDFELRVIARCSLHNQEWINEYRGSSSSFQRILSMHFVVHVRP